ncbi:MAG: SNF2-related protein, partial [Shewanella sp.]
MNRLSPQNPIQLTRTTIESLFTPPTLMRARDYVMKGRVLSAKANADFRHIEGRVMGTESLPYRQDIRLVSVNHKLIMNGFCSCPATGHCKHIAAVLYSLLSDRTVEDQRIAQWLHLLDKSDDLTVSNVDLLYDDRVFYVLSKDDNGVFLELRKGKLAKTGSYNKGSKIALSDVQYYMPAWIGAEDVLIINLIMSTRRHGASRLYIKAPLGAIALEKMLATERCFWEESRLPLTRGEPIKPEFIWLDKDAEHKQMQLTLPNKDNWELIPCEPPSYVDLDYFNIGVLDTDISVEKLLLLSQMPPVPSSLIERVSHKLLQHFSTKTVPTPASIDFVELQVPLQVRLTLTSQVLPEFAMAQPLVLLEFVYQDVVLGGRYPDEALSFVTQGGKTYQVARQIALEKEASDALMMLGLNERVPSFMPNSGCFVSIWGVGPLPEAIDAWLHFIQQQVPRLKILGYQVHFADNFNLTVIDTPLAIELDDSQDGWFSLSLNADIDGQMIPMLPLIATWLKQYGEPADNAELLLPTPNGNWLKVKASVIKPLISIILELFDGHKGHSVSLPKYRAHLLNDFAESDIRLLNGERVRGLATKLDNFNGVVEVAVPEALVAQLRHYQHQGLNWLCFLKEYQLGGILADDMGLGKTIQTLAFLLKQQEYQSTGASCCPSLIICPTSLVGNWAKEAAKFAPSLKLVVIHGALRKPLLERLNEFDIVVTTYPLIVRDS